MTDKVTLHLGDCLEVLSTIPDESVDALVCDPPAGISFMNKEFDHDKGGREQWIAWLSAIMFEVKRVLKPGAHGLVWGLPRTSHWTAMACEVAGLQIRDCVTHIQGQGFPKSLNIGKELSDWQGWGTALKPACEMWWLIRKPLSEKTVAKNVMRYGTGALNIDASRISTTDNLNGGAYSKDKNKKCDVYGNLNYECGEYSQPTGRFPSNLVLSCCGSDPHEDGCAAGELDRQSGVLHPGGQSKKPRKAETTSSQFGIGIEFGDHKQYKDTGGASRFFYVAKASKRERNAGLDCIEIIKVSIGPWENADQKAVLQVDTGLCPPRVIDASGTLEKSVSEWSTLLFGSNISELPPKECKSTTKTETNSITASATLNWLLRCNTSASILDASLSTARGGNHAEAARNSSLSTTTINGATVTVTNASNALSNDQLQIRSAGNLRSTHPTVKPLKLMRYLCRLITPPGGVVLDCFTGSGSTGVAALQEGFRFIGIEQDAEYLEIARKRIEAVGRGV